jgi:hypothetical protein
LGLLFPFSCHDFVFLSATKVEQPKFTEKTHLAGRLRFGEELAVIVIDLLAVFGIGFSKA